MLIAGSSTGLASPPVADALARWLPEAGQNRAQAVANSGTGVGIALSGPVALMAFGGWRWAWLGFAIIAGLVTAWIVLAIPPGVPGAGQRERVGALGVLALVADARSVRLVAAATLFGMATACMWTFGRDHIVSAGGIDETTSTLLWLFLGVAGVIGAAGGDLVTRHGLGATWRACFVIVAVATFSVGAWPGSTAVVAVAMASFGAAYITLTLVVLLWAVRLYPDQVSAGVGCGFLMLALGQAVGAPLAGLLADHLGPGGAFAAFAGLGGLAALAGPRGARGDGRKARTGVSVT